jgi:hypothetical protein
MFAVKMYDLGDQIEKIGYYPEVVEDMAELRREKKAFMRKDSGYRHEMSREQKDIANKKKSINRTRTSLRRKAQKHGMTYMWTLTFAKKMNSIGSKVYDCGDYDTVWKFWRSFLERCRVAGMSFPYVCTVEVQEKRMQRTGEKVYHFHFLTNQRIEIDTMQQLWGNGFVFVSHNKSSKKLAHFYLVKYIAKLVEEMGSGRQRYRTSEGLEVPNEIVYYKDHLDYLLSQSVEPTKTANYSVLGDVLEIFWSIVDKHKT